MGEYSSDESLERHFLRLQPGKGMTMLSRRLGIWNDFFFIYLFTEKYILKCVNKLKKNTQDEVSRPIVYKSQSLAVGQNSLFCKI